MKSAIVSLLFVLTAILVPIVSAQLDCPSIVRDALAATDAACQSTGRNQACYGNISLNITPQADASALTFEQTGDIVDIAQIASLQLSSLDADSGVWGVALMNLQANLPDTLPGQNVRFLLFGDVDIENAGAPPAPQLEMTAAGNANVRAAPGTTASVLTALQQGDTVTAIARLEDSSWLQIQLPDDAEAVGWVSASLLNTSGDIETLNVFAEDGAAGYGPMQAFYFKTGSGDAPCEEAPDSGILIQTPQGAGTINLVVNGVNVQLGSTAYVQAQPGGEMTVNVLEGQAQLEAAGVTITVPAGARGRVPLDNALLASGPPVGPEPYDNADLAALPIGNLEYDITIATALTEAEIAAAAVNPLVPVSGIWLGGNTQNDCGIPIDATASEATLTVAEDGQSFVVSGFEFQQIEPGVYEADMGDPTVRLIYSVTSPESMTFEMVLSDVDLSCTIRGEANFVR